MVPACASMTADRAAPNPAGYSKWTNTTFKAPLLFSAASCLAGNLMYCYAFDARYLWALYAARLLTGLGMLNAHIPSNINILCWMQQLQCKQPLAIRRRLLSYAIGRERGRALQIIGVGGDASLVEHYLAITQVDGANSSLHRFAFLPKSNYAKQCLEFPVIAPGCRRPMATR